MPPIAQRAALEGWREVLAEMSLSEIGRARACWRQPFPPDPAAFQAAGERRDGAEQFLAACQAAGCQPPAWHRLERRTRAAAMAMAGFNLREASWGNGGGAAALAWLKHYREACGLEDLGQLPEPPEQPVAALPHKRDQAAADRGCAAMRDALSGVLPPPPTPPPPPEWVAKMAALGVTRK